MLVKCQICGVPLKMSKLDNHLWRQHRAKVDESGSVVVYENEPWNAGIHFGTELEEKRDELYPV